MTTVAPALSAVLAARRRSRRARPRPRVNVVTTTEGLAAIAREVGGDTVKVTAPLPRHPGPPLRRRQPITGGEAPQRRPARGRGPGPGDRLAPAARDPVPQRAPSSPAGARRLTAASAVVPCSTSRPARSTGARATSTPPATRTSSPIPGARVQVAAAIAARLAGDRSGRTRRTTRSGSQAFRAKVTDGGAGLEGRSSRRCAGRSVITQHKTLTYLLDWAGLKAAGYLEPKPGVAPPPSHVAELGGHREGGRGEGRAGGELLRPDARANQLRGLTGGEGGRHPRRRGRYEGGVGLRVLRGRSRDGARRRRYSSA